MSRDVSPGSRTDLQGFREAAGRGTCGIFGVENPRSAVLRIFPKERLVRNWFGRCEGGLAFISTSKTRPKEFPRSRRSGREALLKT
jgi:hypothetical protein